MRGAWASFPSLPHTISGQRSCVLFPFQYFSVLAVLEGFKWKIDRTYEEFMELQRTVS